MAGGGGLLQLITYDPLKLNKHTVSFGRNHRKYIYAYFKSPEDKVAKNKKIVKHMLAVIKKFNLDINVSCMCCGTLAVYDREAKDFCYNLESLSVLLNSLLLQNINKLIMGYLMEGFTCHYCDLKNKITSCIDMINGHVPWYVLPSDIQLIKNKFVRANKITVNKSSFEVYLKEKEVNYLLYDTKLITADYVSNPREKRYGYTAVYNSFSERLKYPKQKPLKLKKDIGKNRGKK